MVIKVKKPAAQWIVSDREFEDLLRRASAQSKMRKPRLLKSVRPTQSQAV
ncbi:MAG: hypothetical protein ACRD52_02175 [Candidatus Acidiferrales bacterium]